MKCSQIPQVAFIQLTLPARKVYNQLHYLSNSSKYVVRFKLI